MKNRNKKTLILVGVFSLLVFMGVGFALVGTTLNIGGTSTALNTWDIRITNIAAKENETGAKSVSSEIEPTQGVTATFSATFHAPGDYIEYDVEVRNRGSLDATLYSLVATPSGDDVDLFDFSHTAEQGSILKAGESITFTVKVIYKIDSTRLPSGETKFELSINYGQGENAPGGGGNTPGGGGETPEPDNDWDFEVDESGTVVAYNYGLGSDVVVPATTSTGEPITTLKENSLMPKPNVEAYVNESPMAMYAIIDEAGPNFTYVQNKLVTMLTMECQGDTGCEQQYKTILYTCSAKDTCYSVLNREQHAQDPTVELTKVAIPATAQSQDGMYVIPNPELSLEESFVYEATIKSLDLSRATNLTTIEEYAFYSVDLQEVEFGDNSNITSIGSHAFSYNELTNVEIPNSVETIGNYAFYSNQIETLTFGATPTVQNQLTKNKKYALSKLGTTGQKMATTNSKLKSIGDFAFNYNKISSIILPSGLETIGNSAFNSNQITGELVIPSSVATIGTYAFYGNSISKVDFSGNTKLTKIETNVFYGNDITELDIPNSVTSIGSYAFSSNEIAGELVIPSTLTTIESNAFYGNKIDTLYFPNTVTTLGTSAFGDNLIETLTIEECNTTICKGSSIKGNNYFGNKIKTLTIDSGEIGEYAFYSESDSTSKIETLTLGAGVSSIGGSAFSNNLITTIEMPSTLTSIGNSAFSNNSITTIEIPSTLTSIGQQAFENNSINELQFPKTVTTLGYSAFSNNPLQTLTIEKCNTAICKGDANGSSYFGNKIKTLTIGSGEIGQYAFASLSDSTTKIENLTLGEGVTLIDTYAFANNLIANLDLPSTLESLAGFQNNLLMHITIPSNVTKIGSSAFENNKLTELSFDNNSKLTRIESRAFFGNNINQVMLPEGVTSINGNAFANASIGTFYLPQKVTYLDPTYPIFEGTIVENLIIANCNTTTCRTSSTYFRNQIKKLTIESGEIGSNAFASNEDSTIKIQQLELGEGVTSIGQYAFSNNEITSVVFPEGLTTIGMSAFENNLIESINISSTLVTIGIAAFRNNEISELYFPKTVTTLERLAFSDNPLQILTVEECNTTICKGTTTGNEYFGTQIKNLTIESGKIGDSAFFVPSDSATKIETLELGEGVTSIEMFAFDNNLIKTINIPSTLLSIGYGAFRNNQINSIEFAENSNLITIDYYAFYNNQLTTLKLPKGLTTINHYSFVNNQISELYFPKSVTTISDGAFFNNTNNNFIQTLTIEECIQSICSGSSTTGNKYFGNKITDLTIEGGEIGSSAFASTEDSTTKIQRLELKEGVTQIGSRAFIYNEIQTLNLPIGLTLVESNAFAYNRIKTLNLSTGLTVISAMAFGYNEIKTLNLPTSLITIDSRAFIDNQISGELIIPEGVQVVNSMAFLNNRITSLNIPSTIGSVGNGAFMNQNDENGNNVLSHININMSSDEFNSMITTTWYDKSNSSITVNYAS